MNRRFVHVVMNNRIAGPCAYTVHSINASTFFYPSRTDRSAAAAAATMEDDQMPPPAMNFHIPCSPPAYYGGMSFMSLGRDKNHIVGVDHEGRTILYDTTLRAVRTMPAMTARKPTFPMSLAVGGNLYVMGSRPGQHSFEALIHGHSMRSPGKDWFWRSLPPPPYVHDPGYYHVGDLDDPYLIGAYTVVGDSQIWISTAGLGTCSFDTASHEWSKPIDSPLPFGGLVEYVPEHGLWFGFSAEEGNHRFCACDLLAADHWPAPPPVLQNEWELDLGTPKDWIPTGSYLVPLGSGRFCIAKLFTRLEEVVSVAGHEYENVERFAVFMGVEVERRDGDDGGVRLRMIKHKSKRYSLEDSMVDQVL